MIPHQLKALSALRLWGLLTIFLCASAVVRAAPEKTLWLVTEAWPPYAYECGGEPCGVDVELVTHVLERLGYRIHIQFVPWPRAMAQLQGGKADAILDISKGVQNEREQILLFPAEPLSSSSNSLFYRKSEPFRYQGLASLSGKRVALVRGYNYSANFMSAPYFSRELGMSHEQNMKKLARGRVDLALMDTAVGLYLIRTLHLEEQITRDPTLFSAGKLYLAFASRPTFAGLVTDFEQELRAYKKTAEYEQLLVRYGLASGAKAPQR